MTLKVYVIIIIQHCFRNIFNYRLCMLKWKTQNSSSKVSMEKGVSGKHRFLLKLIGNNAFDYYYVI